MRQRRLNLKSPRNEMPSPRDPRLKIYDQQRAIDREALRLIAEGVPHQEAYHRAMKSIL